MLQLGLSSSARTLSVAFLSWLILLNRDPNEVFSFLPLPDYSIYLPNIQLACSCFKVSCVYRGSRAVTQRLLVVACVSVLN